MHEICADFPWWYMTILGSVDGFSRLPVSLGYVSNNKSKTLLSCFIKDEKPMVFPVGRNQIREKKIY